MEEEGWEHSGDDKQLGRKDQLLYQTGILNDHACWSQRGLAESYPWQEPADQKLDKSSLFPVITHPYLEYDRKKEGKYQEHEDGIDDRPKETQRGPGIPGPDISSDHVWQEMTMFNDGSENPHRTSYY